MKPGAPARLIGLMLLVAAAAAAGAQRPAAPMGSAQPGAGPASPFPDRPPMPDRGPVAGDPFGRAEGGLGRAGVGQEGGLATAAMATARSVADAHFRRLKRLVEADPQVLELIDRTPAIRGEIVAIDPSPTALEAARRLGYRLVADETVEGLGTRYVTLGTPGRKSLKRALAELRRLAPATEFAANHLHVQSGAAAGLEQRAAALAASSVVVGSAIGIIDGGVGVADGLPGLAQRGFARGAPAPDAHATAVASLTAGLGRVRSGSPGTPLLIADIYGNDPKGGNSLALAKALGWMASRNVPVVLISLVGPSNAIVASAISRVQARGMHVVAPVGNAGPAAPPMFPASYRRVIAVTGVDARNRALIEAGRGPHLDYAAPGADIVAASPGGKLVKVRGTSFAAPLVAGRLWRAGRSGDAIAALDREAIDLGPRGADRIFGRGLVCGECR